jgi:hypothetical protein
MIERSHDTNAFLHFGGGTVGRIDDEARNLAQRHYQVEVGLRDIIRLEQKADVEVIRTQEHVEKIGLLEVNENTVPSGIMPIEFAPAPAAGIHYPAVIIEVTPDEFELIKSSELALPSGWVLGEAIPRPNGSPP